MITQIKLFQDNTELTRTKAVHRHEWVYLPRKKTEKFSTSVR